MLDSSRTSYLFTDVSDVFLERARARFREYPFVNCARFDLEKDPAEQGFVAGTFDLIAAANVVHAVAELGPALRRLHSLLAPGGMLALIETTEHMSWFDVTTGLIEGWNVFADSGRDEHPLRGALQWKELLVKAGFDECASYPSEMSRTACVGQRIILARRRSGQRASVSMEPRSKPAEVPEIREAAPAAWKWVDQSGSLNASDRWERMLDCVAGEIAGIMQFRNRLLDPRQRLMDAGMDSLMAVQLRNRLSEVTGLALPASLMFDYPTIEDLSKLLLERMGLAPADVAAAERREQSRLGDRLDVRCGSRDDVAGEARVQWSDQTRKDQELSPIKRAYLAIEELQARLKQSESRAREPIAIVGMACRFPGQADNPDAFWAGLAAGKSGIREIDNSRWDMSAYYDPNPGVRGKMAARHAGLISGIDGFDPQFFEIAPREARQMDPQQRLALEVSWESLEDAGISSAALYRSRSGVFFGICSNDYAQLTLQSGDWSLIDVHYASGVAHSVAAGRLSYLLGLQGPSLAIDTACSSSLVAVHLACQSLRNRECDLALAGGVNPILTPEASVAFSNARMLAADGKCKTFDARADGFVRGEGCGVVVLKRLSDADGGGRPDPGGDPGVGGEPGWSEFGVDGAERKAQEAVMRRGADERRE